MIQALRASQLHIAEALQRLEVEADHGTFTASRYRGKYVSWGDGPALIFLHGLADNIHAFTLPMAALAREFRCICYNQPSGCGDGARLWDYGHDLLVDDLIALMDHLHISQAYLAGHSFGSTIALRALHAHPERFPRGMLLCGFAQRRLKWGELLLACGFRFCPGTVQLLPFRKHMFEECHREHFHALEPERWQAFLEITGRTSIGALAHWALTLHRTDVVHLLPQIQQPVLVACGDRDPLVPHARQVMLFNRLPNATMFQIDNCGHFPNFTHPEAIADAARRFLLAPMCKNHHPAVDTQVTENETA